MVRWLMDAGFLDKTDRSVCFAAAKGGQLALLQWLLSNGFRLIPLPPDGPTGVFFPEPSDEHKCMQCYCGA